LIRPAFLAGAIAGESLKMLRRPAVYVLGTILLAILVLISYLLGWLFLTYPPAGTRFPQGVTAADLKKAFYPVNMVREALTNASVLGGVLALILGVLAVGSEYGWGTLKTILTQRPGRLEVFLAKVVAVAGTLAVFAVLNLAAAATMSVLLGLADQQPLTFPDPVQIAAGLGATWLIWNWYAAFGAFLAYSFRQSALAIGIGLAYVLVIDTVLFGVIAQLGGAVLQAVERFFPGPNAMALIQSFGSVTPDVAQNIPRPIVGAWQATIVLFLYLLAALVASAILLRNRDVT
jgi:ABC-2 type transport system permease protein